MKQTIFLTGHRKSGTTLLKSLLDGHPNISSYPTDLTLLYSYFPHVKLKKYSKERLIKKIIFDVLSSLKLVSVYTNYKKKDLENFKKQLKKKLNLIDLLSEKQVISTVLDCWKNHFLTEKKDYFLLKETTQSMNYKLLKKIFPNIKIIQIIRDPRDNYSSLKSGFIKYYQKIGYQREDLLLSAIFRIKNDLKFARYLKNKKYFLCLKYENLVQTPKLELKKIFNFLGIKNYDFQIKPTISNKTFYGNNFNQKLFGISKKNVRKWHKRITKKEEDFINFYLEEEIKFWKYPVIKNYDLSNVKTIYEMINSKFFYKSRNND